MCFSVCVSLSQFSPHKFAQSKSFASLSNIMPFKKKQAKTKTAEPQEPRRSPRLKRGRQRERSQQADVDFTLSASPTITRRLSSSPPMSTSRSPSPRPSSRSPSPRPSSRSPSPPLRRAVRSSSPPLRRAVRSPSPPGRRAPAPEPISQDRFLSFFPGPRGAFYWQLWLARAGTTAPGRTFPCLTGPGPIEISSAFPGHLKKYFFSTYLSSSAALDFFVIPNVQLIADVKREQNISFDGEQIVPGKNPKSLNAAVRQASTNFRMHLKPALQV